MAWPVPLSDGDSHRRERWQSPVARKAWLSVPGWLDFTGKRNANKDFDNDGFSNRGVGYWERYLTGGIPRSLQIFLARMSIISVWRGTADRLFNVGLCHQECRAPSRSCTHPCSRKYRSNSCRFIWRLVLHESLRRLRRGRPVCSIPRPRVEFPADL